MSIKIISMKFITEEQKAKLIEFFQKNKLVILPVLALILIFFVVMAFSQLDQEKQAQAIPTQAPNEEASSPVATGTEMEAVTMPTSKELPSPIPTEAPVVDPGQPDAATFEKTWEESSSYVFSEDYLKDVAFEKRQLPDGSTTYTYASDNNNRPDMIMVKDGVVVFKRMIVVDMTVDNYIVGQGKPDYIARGSKFWGPDAVTYLYFRMGIAFVANPKTNVVFEDMTFKPVLPAQYKQIYGEDLIGNLDKP